MRGSQLNATRHRHRSSANSKGRWLSSAVDAQRPFTLQTLLTCCTMTDRLQAGRPRAHGTDRHCGRTLSTCTEDPTPRSMQLSPSLQPATAVVWQIIYVVCSLSACLIGEVKHAGRSDKQQSPHKIAAAAQLSLMVAGARPSVLKMLGQHMSNLGVRGEKSAVRC